MLWIQKFVTEFRKKHIYFKLFKNIDFFWDFFWENISHKRNKINTSLLFYKDLLTAANNSSLLPISIFRNRVDLEKIIFLYFYNWARLKMNNLI
jgi:hypothetical protein